MAGAVRDIIRARLGANASPVHNRLASSVGLAIIPILRNDPDRIAALIVNLSVNVIYVGPFNNVSTTKGIRLNAGGGLVSLSAEEDYDLVYWEWFAVADAAGSAVYTAEWLVVP